MKEIFEQFGIYIGPIASLVTTVGIILPILRKLNVNKKRLKREKIEQILSPISKADSIISAILETKYYIPVMAQEEEPKDSDSYLSTQPSIVDILIGEWKKMDIGKKKRYIVWGGSGTGKTTFLAALVYKYIMSFNLNKEPYHIKVFGLNDIDDNIFTEIAKVNEQEKTILILDALDENFDANKDVEAFMDRINKATWRFSIVIITSRQVFSRENNLKEIPILGLNGQLQWKYYYILPFNDADVQRYLGEKYKGDLSNYRRAINIVNKSSTLMSRALVLSYIDDLKDLNPNSLTRAQLYKHIVDKWLYRELGAVHGEDKKLIYKTNYYHFSSIIANEMYDNWKQNSKLSLSKGELDNLVNEHIDLFPNNYYPFNVRSLVERNSNDEYRFAHKSFWEFFLAIYSIEKPGHLFSSKDFLGATQDFVNDITHLYYDENVQYNEINYYNPMRDDRVSNIDLDAAVQEYENADDNEKTIIYNRLQCALYCKFCYDSDYKYANYQLSQTGNRDIVTTNYLETHLDTLHIFRVIHANSGDLTYIKKAMEQISFEVPPNILPVARAKRVVYQASISDIQLSYYQIWFASSFISDESALIQSLKEVLCKIQNGMLNHSRHSLVSTVGIIREIEEDAIPSFVMSLQTGLENELKESGVILLIDIICDGCHIPFALSEIPIFKDQNEVINFINKMNTFLSHPLHS